MNLRSLQQNWDKLGELDPMWAVLSEPSKLGHGWNEAEFYSTGEREVDAVMQTVARLFPDASRRHALDFGCGLGRLSRALARRFDAVTGVDIAPSMIAKARRLNSGIANCRFVLNAADDLRAFESRTFDFVYTDIVLQHMHPRYARAYIREFARVAASGGIVVFRLPDRYPIRFSKWLKAAAVPLVPYIPRPLMRAYLRRHYPNAPSGMLLAVQEHPMELHGAKKSSVLALLAQSGAPARYVEEDVGEGWRSFRYFARKSDPKEAPQARPSRRR